MKLSELFAGQDVRIEGADVDASALVYDSRKLVPGALFAALRGSKRDGHELAAAAVTAGATSVLCERPVDVGAATRVLAHDSRRALALCAKRFFGAPSDHLTMVGVTGTNGKTTTTHLVQAILAAAGETTGLIGTLGIELGGRTVETGMTTPESVDLLAILADMLRQGARAVAMEVSSHALAQERVAGVDYDVGVFTNLTHDHLDYHGTLDAYFEAKARLMRERSKRGGHAVLNFDDPRVRALGDERAWTFSARGAAAARVRAEAVRLSLEGTSMTVAAPGLAFEIASPLVGRFNVENLLAAVSAALALGISPEVIARGVAGMCAVPGRLERVSGAGEPLVVVDYAHTPDALEKALTTLREVARGRLVCVFGCGGDRDPHKRGPMGEVAARHADLAVVTSDNPRTEDPRHIVEAIEAGLRGAGARPSAGADTDGYLVELDRAAAIELAVGQSRPGDVVLIAGKGHETYQIVGEVKRPFDDREVARAALAQRAACDGSESAAKRRPA